MKALILVGMVTAIMFLAACQPAPSSFEECVEAGNPVMESHPRQCAAQGRTFVEELPDPVSLSPAHECTPEEQQAEVCTLEYQPVCAFVDNGVRCVTAPCASTDARTFGNGCQACGNPAQEYYEGVCEDLLFVVCKETVTGFSAEEFAANSNGICVDICPGNYDPYMTQIGVELCIPKYGEKEISAWQVCERSSESCECVLASETTAGEPIDDAEYRCVPQQYAERLLFRSGQDRLDEDGERSVAIA